MSRPEHRSRDLLLGALAGRRLSGGDVRFLESEAARSTNDNRALMGAAALLMGNEWPRERFEEQGAVKTMGWELGSWLYAWWTLGALAACWQRSPAARARLRAEVEWCRLTAAPVRSIRLLLPNRAQERKKRRAPAKLCGMPASRYLWSLDLADRRWQPELAVQPRLRARGWLKTSNPELQWAGELLYKISPIAPGPLLPLVKGQRIELRQYADGSLVTAARRTTHRTRGPIACAMIRRGVLTLATSTKPQPGESGHRRHGEWFGTVAELREREAAVRGPLGDLSLSLPREPETFRLVWTDQAPPPPARRPC